MNATRNTADSTAAQTATSNTDKPRRYSRGPWTIQEQFDDHKRGPYSIESPACTVAGDVSGIGAEAEANARLIAAAPELVEALSRLFRVASIELKDSRPDVLQQARAALAKAGVTV